MVSLRDLDEKGQDVRAWCWGCARGEVIASDVWRKFERKGWAGDLEAASVRFRCRQCDSSAHVQLFPARRKIEPFTGGASDYVVATMFHAMRSAGKKRRR